MGAGHFGQMKLLTRMEAIWEYVAGHSRVRPMVRKKRERRLKTSDSVVSSLLLYVVPSSRTSFKRVTNLRQAGVSRDREREARGRPHLA